MKLEDILVTSMNPIEDLGLKLKHDMIDIVDITIVGHFNNCICLDIRTVDGRSILNWYNNTGNIGFLIRAFVELFDASHEDGIFMRNIHNIPCRLILDSYNRCIGFGHISENKFVFSKDFVKIDE